MTNATLIMMFALAQTVPCHDTSPLSGMEFDEYRAGQSYQVIRSGFGDAGGVTLSLADGKCMEVVTVDQAVHADVLGERGITIDAPLLIEFGGQDCWGVVVYVASDTYAPKRFPQMDCYAGDVYIGGDRAHTPFGPGSFPFQYLVKIIMRTVHLPNYEALPIDWCVVYPGGAGVFVGLIQLEFDEALEE